MKETTMYIYQIVNNETHRRYKLALQEGLAYLYADIAKEMRMQHLIEDVDGNVLRSWPEDTGMFPNATTVAGAAAKAWFAKWQREVVGPDAVEQSSHLTIKVRKFSVKTLEETLKNPEKIERITLPDSVMARLLRKHNIDLGDVLVKLDCELPKDYDLQYPEAHLQLQKVAAAGEILIDGVKYRHFGASAGNRRNSITNFIREDVYDQIVDLAYAGKHPHEPVVLAKDDAYKNIDFSASTEFVDKFGRPFDSRRVAIVDDLEVPVESMCTYVDSDGNVYPHEKRTQVIKVTDGLCIINGALVDDGFTGRGLESKKGLAQPANFEFAAKTWGSMIPGDHWDDPVKLADVDLLIFKSACKFTDRFTSSEDYRQTNERYDRTLSVAVKAPNKKPRYLPLQVTQQLMGTKQQVDAAVDLAKQDLARFSTVDGKINSLSGVMRDLARMAPDILNTAVFKVFVEDAYANARKKLVGGNLPNGGTRHFLALDLVAVFQHLYKVPVTGCIPAGCVYVPTLPDGQEVLITRSPVTDQGGFVIATNKHPDPEWKPLFKGNSCFLSAFDNNVDCIKGDLDGDCVTVTTEPLWIELAKYIKNGLGAEDIIWDVKTQAKEVRTAATQYRDIMSLAVPAPIGILSDNNSRIQVNALALWKAKRMTMAEYWAITALQTRDINLGVDSAKGTSQAQTAVSETQRKFLSLLRGDKVYEPLKLGLVHRANKLRKHEKKEKKESKNGQKDEKKLNEERQKWDMQFHETNSFADRYSKAVQENTSETLPVDPTVVPFFDWKLLLPKDFEYKTVSGLFRIGKPKNQKEREEGVADTDSFAFKDFGCFQALAFRTRNEWEQLKDDDHYPRIASAWERGVGSAAWEELCVWAATPKQSPDGPVYTTTIEEIYCNLVKALFGKANKSMSPENLKLMVRFFFTVFGKMAMKILRQNLGSSEPIEFTEEPMFDDDRDDDRADASEE